MQHVHVERHHADLLLVNNPYHSNRRNICHECLLLPVGRHSKKLYHLIQPPK